ncbi:hypothetical protein STCU_12092 [Strigomonas culicis]|uniref:Surface antigen-like protein n=1 Tax=Strigomonas culicis TaxID=28005 RepID=S9TEF7_9TRYP|nr:hypothetical protein STCU_12092 [Strigomonas culicis]|eukprot:EPY15354.1 hypothetical protein STCU_12092 [Strigomonas culicis]
MSKIVLLLAALVLVHVASAAICSDYKYYDSDLDMCLPCPDYCSKCTDFLTCEKGYCDSGTDYALGLCVKSSGTSNAASSVYAAALALCATSVALLY